MYKIIKHVSKQMNTYSKCMRIYEKQIKHIQTDKTDESYEVPWHAR